MQPWRCWGLQMGKMIYGDPMRRVLPIIMKLECAVLQSSVPSSAAVRGIGYPSSFLTRKRPKDSWCLRRKATHHQTQFSIRVYMFSFKRCFGWSPVLRQTCIIFPGYTLDSPCSQKGEARFWLWAWRCGRFNISHFGSCWTLQDFLCARSLHSLPRHIKYGKASSFTILRADCKTLQTNHDKVLDCWLGAFSLLLLLCQKSDEWFSHCFKWRLALPPLCHKLTRVSCATYTPKKEISEISRIYLLNPGTTALAAPGPAPGSSCNGQQR